MNILPLVFVLLFTLAVVSMAHLEQFKKASLNHIIYEKYIRPNKNFVLNQRQEKLFHEGQKETWRHVSIRVFLNAELRKKTDEKTYQANRFLLIELMKVLYSKAAFFKSLKQKRPEFLDELVVAIENAAIKAESNHKKPIKRIQDIVRLDLEDPELQGAFYHMLKGTTNKKEQLKEPTNKKKQDIIEPTIHNQERTYLSLLTFVNMLEETQVKIKLAAPEVLRAIFPNDEIVDSIIAKRDLVDSKNAEAVNQFKQEFLGKQRPEVSDQQLDFTFSGAKAIDPTKPVELNKFLTPSPTSGPHPAKTANKKGK